MTFADERTKSGFRQDEAFAASTVFFFYQGGSSVIVVNYTMKPRFCAFVFKHLSGAGSNN